MKMTFDLPADVAKRLRIKAAEEGLKLKDLIAEACRNFLDQPKGAKKVKAVKSPFPFFKGGNPAKRGSELTPEMVDDILWGSTE